MKTRCVTLGHMSKNSVIRFRCEEDLAARFQRVAYMRRREESDLARLWFEDMVLAEEQRLGLILSQHTLRDKPVNSTSASPASDSLVSAASGALDPTSSPAKARRPGSSKAAKSTASGSQPTRHHQAAPTKPRARKKA